MNIICPFCISISGYGTLGMKDGSQKINTWMMK